MDAVVGFAYFRILALLSGAAFAAAAFAGGDYLVRVGPKALMFAARPLPRDPEKVLPPLAMTDPAPTNSVPDEAAPLIGSPDPGAPDFVGPMPESAATAPEEAPLRQTTPDALLQFFTPGARRNTVITTPVEFAPPAANPKSSSATYVSP